MTIRMNLVHPLPHLCLPCLSSLCVKPFFERSRNQLASLVLFGIVTETGFLPFAPPGFVTAQLVIEDALVFDKIGGGVRARIGEKLIDAVAEAAQDVAARDAHQAQHAVGGLL